MKIYIVTDGTYSDYRIKEVFSVKKEAEKYQKIFNCENIETFELYDNALKAIEEENKEEKLTYQLIVDIDERLNILERTLTLKPDWEDEEKYFKPKKRTIDTTKTRSGVQPFNDSFMKRRFEKKIRKI